MNNEAEIILLKIISSNASLDPLFKMGYLPSQISSVLNNAIGSGLLSNDNGKILLTQTGREKLKNHYYQNKIYDSNQWIMPLRQYKTTPISKYDIFLPEKL